MGKGITLWRYRRRFAVDTASGIVTIRSRSDGLYSDLALNGDIVAHDRTPAFGPESVRNHRLDAQLPDGTPLSVEAGYISIYNVAIAVSRDARLIHESHPGRPIAYPEKYRAAAASMPAGSFAQTMKQGFTDGTASNAGLDFGKLKRNRIPLIVDILLGLVFFVVAKLTDLTTAALVGAALGVALLIAQKVTRVDLLGGLAMFAIVMLLLSAGLALYFQTDEAVKYRSTVIGSISAVLFFADGVLGGKRLASRLAVYLPYSDIDPARLGIGMGLLGMVLAGANQAVAMWTSTDVWLFYSTFVDFILSMALIMLVFRYARGQMLRETAPRYKTEKAV
ncbi:MAG: septation protein IspZ [Pontixanthobacter sp.]